MVVIQKGLYSSLWLTHYHTMPHSDALKIYSCRKHCDKRQIWETSELKELADDNFKIYENGGRFSKRVENTVGKGEIACYEQFLLSPQCFQRTCSADM